jgi:hypothetical protein
MQAIPVQTWTGSDGSRFHDNGHMKVVRSALRTGRLYPQEMPLVLNHDTRSTLEGESTPAP